ncbi:non-homologous end joining protein Ku [Thermosulfuriphilus sp.]
MRAIWSGVLKISLVTIPVKLYQAVIKKGLTFHLVHKVCGTRIRYEKVCPNCDRAVADEEIARAWPLDNEHYIIITDEELEELRLGSSEAIEVKGFLRPEEIPPAFYADSHYLVPDGSTAGQAFALFYRAMEESGRAALATAIIRHKERPLIIKPYQGKFLTSTLHFKDEVIPAEDLAINLEQGDEKGLYLAKTIVENLSIDFDPETLVDHYRESVLALIEAKARGEALKPRPEREKAKVISLMEALRQSAEETARKRLVRARKRTKGKRVRQTS